jgi:hypothetical protein
VKAILMETLFAVGVKPEYVRHHEAGTARRGKGRCGMSCERLLSAVRYTSAQHQLRLDSTRMNRANMTMYVKDSRVLIIDTSADLHVRWSAIDDRMTVTRVTSLKQAIAEMEQSQYHMVAMCVSCLSEAIYGSSQQLFVWLMAHRDQWQGCHIFLYGLSGSPRLTSAQKEGELLRRNGFKCVHVLPNIEAFDIACGTDTVDLNQHGKAVSC